MSRNIQNHLTYLAIRDEKSIQEYCNFFAAIGCVAILAKSLVQILCNIYTSFLLLWIAAVHVWSTSGGDHAALRSLCKTAVCCSVADIFSEVGLLYKSCLNRRCTPNQRLRRDYLARMDKIKYPYDHL
jgi:hypothetical protein